MTLKYSDKLTFQAEGHIYHYNAKRVPSNTQVLSEYIKIKVGRDYYYVNTVNGAVIDAYIFEAAQDFGTAIHNGAKIIVEKDLDWDSLDDDLVAPLMDYRHWVRENIKEPIFIEVPMYSLKYNYATIPDIVAKLRDDIIHIIEIKTGKSTLVGPQTAAQEQAFRENTGYKGKIIRNVLHISKNGEDCKLEICKDRLDWNYFLIKRKLYDYQWRSK